MSKERKQSTEAAVREIRRKTRRKFAPEQMIRIVLEGLRASDAQTGFERFRQTMPISIYTYLYVSIRIYTYSIPVLYL
jgi:hypothetical protein